MKVVVLGTGLVGAPMAKDLAKDSSFEVMAVDINPEALSRLSQDSEIRTIKIDLSNLENVKRIVKENDLVVNALPGSLGYQTLRAIIEEGKDVVDISFFPEEPFTLDSLAREKGVTAVVDCGVAPGLSHILVGYASRKLDEIDTVKIYVGGLPEVREWPYEYKAGFSPADVIEEYIRPARYIENGKLKEKPALSEVEYINFPQVGTLEAVMTDGLRTLLRTIQAKNAAEKTLRYPGHSEKMKMLRETGFFSKQLVAINGIKVRPLDLTATLLFPKWKLGESDRDFTVMRVIVEGKGERKGLRFEYELFDRYDDVTRTHSMARTTGYTATICLRMIAQRIFSRKGICPPELIGEEEGCVKFLLEELRKRGIFLEEKVEEIG